MKPSNRTAAVVSLITVLRWVGAVLLPIPALVIIPFIVQLGLSWAYVDPTTLFGQFMQCFLSGSTLSAVPRLIAPSHKCVAGAIITSIYFSLGIYFTISLYGEPHSTTTGQIFILIGMAFGIGIHSYEIKDELKQKRKEREYRKDVKDLMLIAKDFLPRDTYDKFHIAKSNHTIKDLYDTYFALLLFIWLHHLCESANEDPNLFREIAQEEFPLPTRIYNSMWGEIGFYSENTVHAVGWATKHLTSNHDDAEGLANLFKKLIGDVCKANNFISPLGW